MSLLELLDLLRTLHGVLPQVTRDAWRTGDQKYYVSDTRKFFHATGWLPQHSVEDGVRKLYQWLSESMKLRAYPVTGFDREIYTAAGLEAR